MSALNKDPLMKNVMKEKNIVKNQMAKAKLRAPASQSTKAAQNITFSTKQFCSHRNFNEDQGKRIEKKAKASKTDRLTFAS